ncbi:sulfatase family protein [Haloarcula halophila]|uniref:sulfatase family protein n=1 Tax=Haloarcula TaxID=2237 RepID=UPI0023E3B4AA|nr:sulfatase-like hydrolase/transferase [Halomicroarcula sp. DFY41]
MPDHRPNILWICTDQQRWDTLGCYGADHIDTPHLDELAGEGIRFQRAYCQSPVCTPSRASMLTGRYPRTTRCRQNGQPMPRDERLVTTHLSEAGYRCGLAGKLHLSPTNPDDNTDATTREPARSLDDGYGTVHWSPMPGDDSPDNQYRQWLRGRGESFERTPYEGSSYVETSMSPDNHQTAWCTDRAIEYVRTGADADHPWLFSLNYFDPHHPFDPPAAYLEKYVDRIDDLPPPNYAPGELDDKPAVQHEAAHTGRLEGANMSADEHRLVRAAYYAMIDFVDDQVGRLLAELDATGQRSDTIVVFTADHGEMLGDHGIYKKGPYFYEPAVRVPLIISQPGTVHKGDIVDDLVALTDLAPTLVAAAGLEQPAGMQGRSLWPLVRTDGTTPTRPHRESVYCEFYDATKRHTDPRVNATMVRTDRYKLVTHHDTDDGELYDLATDPVERRNRWADPELAETKARLLGTLADRIAGTVDPLPERLGSW